MRATAQAGNIACAGPFQTPMQEASEIIKAVCASDHRTRSQPKSSILHLSGKRLAGSARRNFRQAGA
jgi:hypothetical protein